MIVLILAVLYFKQRRKTKELTTHYEAHVSSLTKDLEAKRLEFENLKQSSEEAGKAFLVLKDDFALLQNRILSGEDAIKLKADLQEASSNYAHLQEILKSRDQQIAVLEQNIKDVENKLQAANQLQGQVANDLNKTAYGSISRKSFSTFISQAVSMKLLTSAQAARISHEEDSSKGLAELLSILGDSKKELEHRVKEYSSSVHNTYAKAYDVVKKNLSELDKTLEDISAYVRSRASIREKVFSEKPGQFPLDAAEAEKFKKIEEFERFPGSAADFLDTVGQLRTWLKNPTSFTIRLKKRTGQSSLLDKFVVTEPTEESPTEEPDVERGEEGGVSFWRRRPSKQEELEDQEAEEYVEPDEVSERPVEGEIDVSPEQMSFQEEASRLEKQERELEEEDIEELKSRTKKKYKQKSRKERHKELIFEE